MFSEYLYFSTGILLWICAFLIFILKTQRAFYFIAGHLLIMGLGIITRSLTSAGLMQEYPHLYLILSPLHFLYGPLYFYFILTFFRTKYQFTYKDAFHLSPFLIHLIDYLPFYVTSAVAKRMIMQSEEDVSAFGIPVLGYNLLKSISFIFYILLTGWFYFHFFYNTRFSNPKIKRFIYYWLRCDYILKLVALLSYVFLVFIQKQHLYSVAYYLFSLDSFLNIIVVFKYPNLLKETNVLYDNKAWVQSPSFFSMLKHTLFRRIRRPVDKLVLAERINYCFNVQQLFLDDQMNEEKLSHKLNVSAMHVDAYTQETNGCSCEDFIQYKRLEYLSQKMNSDNEWIHLPLFKTVFMAGFNSVTSLQATFVRYQATESLRFFHFDPKGLSRINAKLSELLTQEA